MLTAELGAQPPQPVDALRDPVERLAPEELHVGLGRRDALRRLRGAAEVDPRVGAVAADDGPRPQRRARHREVLARVRDLLLRPQPADDLQELARAGVAVRRVGLAVAVRLLPVGAGHDVDAQPAAAQVVEGRGGGREVRGPPEPGPDRDERLERRGAGRERRRDRERVGTPPARPEQRAREPVAFQGVRVARQGVEAVVVLGGVVTAVSRPHLVRDVPEVLAHARAPSTTRAPPSDDVPAGAASV